MKYHIDAYITQPCFFQTVVRLMDQIRILSIGLELACN